MKVKKDPRHEYEDIDEGLKEVEEDLESKQKDDHDKVQKDTE